MSRIVLLAVGAIAALTITLPPSGTRADARSEKIALYIEIHNAFAISMHAHHERFTAGLAGFDAESPCTAERQPSAIFHHAGDATGTIPDFERRLRRAPRLPQDRLAQQMMDAAEAEHEAWNGAEDYYRRRIFTTDACARGNAYHRALVAAYAAYFPAEQELLAFVEENARAMHREELARTEREHGRGFRYHQILVMDEVEAIHAVLRVDALDVDALERAIEGVSRAHAEIAPQAETAPREVHADLYSGGYLAFLQRVGALVDLGRTLVRLLRDPRAEARDVERAGRDFERAYADVVQTSNGVHYTPRVR